MTVTIRCDHLDCSRLTAEVEAWELYEEGNCECCLGSEATKAGWVEVKGEHFCPRHAPSLDAASDHEPH